MNTLGKLLAALGASLLAAPASAQTHAGVDANLVRPSFDGFGVLSLDGATSLHQYDFALQLGVGFAQQPLNMPVLGIGEQGLTDTGSDSVLEHAVTFNFTTALAFTDRLSFGFDVGLYQTQPDAGYGERGVYMQTEPTGLISLRPISNIDPSGGFVPDGHSVPSDVRVGFKYRLSSGPGLRLAVLANVYVPFGDEEMFLGERSFVFEPKVAFEKGLGANGRMVANVGAKLRKRTVLEAFEPTMQEAADAQVVYDLGSEITAGAGVLYELAPQLLVGVEANVFIPLPSAASWGSCTRANGEDCDDLGDEDYFNDAGSGDLAGYALAGLHYRATPDTTIALSGGSGAMFGDGRGENFRVTAGIVWAPTPAGTKTIGKGDADGDGVGDQIDICPDEPEDRDGYQDDDGCPDLDNDGDGVIDARDACPDEPEDRDGHEDDDGCAEKDNDGDGIPDVTDRCPDDAEDKDGFDDEDGCPEEDNDGDGIKDDKDKCPNEPETVNGFDDTDGCPDESVRGGPKWDPDRIDLQGSRVEFINTRSSKLTKATREILDQVAQLMTDKTDRKIRIEVHVRLGTTSSNPRVIKSQKAKDKRLAQQRADEIRDYLISKGVPAANITASGLGSDLPIRPEAPTSEENERVDFIRVEQR